MHGLQYSATHFSSLSSRKEREQTPLRYSTQPSYKAAEYIMNNCEEEEGENKKRKKARTQNIIKTSKKIFLQHYTLIQQSKICPELLLASTKHIPDALAWKKPNLHITESSMSLTEYLSGILNNYIK